MFFLPFLAVHVASLLPPTNHNVEYQFIRKQDNENNGINSCTQWYKLMHTHGTNSCTPKKY